MAETEKYKRYSEFKICKQNGIQMIFDVRIEKFNQAQSCQEV